MSSLNLKPSPQNLLIAGAVLYILMRARAKAAGATPTTQTTNQQYALWQQLGLTDIVKGLASATLGNTQPTNTGPGWSGTGQPLTPSWWTTTIAGEAHPSGLPTPTQQQTSDFWGSLT